MQWISISGVRSDSGVSIAYGVIHFESPDKETDMCIVREGDSVHWSIDNPVFRDDTQHIEFAKMLRGYIGLRRSL